MGDESDSRAMPNNPIDNRPQEVLVVAAYTTTQSDFQIPPGIIRRPGSDEYVGHFENTYGELWVLTIDRKRRTGWLRGHETGWDPFPISGEFPSSLYLAPEERLWLDACWRAATGEPLKPSPLDRFMEMARTMAETLLRGGEVMGEDELHGRQP